MALFFESSRILFLSQGEDEAWELLSKARFVYSQLPAEMKLPANPNQRGTIGFPDNHSQMRALASTEIAGHGYHASLVIRDELEHHPCAELNFAAIGPAIDAGGQQIDLSTVDKRKAIDLSHFKTRYIQAKNGMTTAFPVFLPWWLRPVRSIGMPLKEWFEGIKKKYPAWMVEQEYPESEEDALDVLQSVAFFDKPSLEAMKYNVLMPVSCDEVPSFNGLVTVFKPPVVGNVYCAFTDPSDGAEDPFHTVVVNVRTGEGVCEAHGKLKADQVARIHDAIVRSYNNAFNSFEKNSPGFVLREILDNLGTPKQDFRRKPDGRIATPQEHGWYTTPQHKRNMLWDLEKAVRNREVTIHRVATIDEFKTMLIPMGEEPSVPKGMHDDAIMAWAGVWQLKKHVPLTEAKVYSRKYI